MFISHTQPMTHTQTNLMDSCFPSVWLLTVMIGGVKAAASGPTLEMTVTTPPLLPGLLQRSSALTDPRPVTPDDLCYSVYFLHSLSH